VEDIQRIVKDQDIGLIILADNQMASYKYKECPEPAPVGIAD